MTPHAGLVLAQMLAERNVPRVFSVPGESFLAALDGFYEFNQLAAHRQERIKFDGLSCHANKFVLIGVCQVDKVWIK